MFRSWDRPRRVNDIAGVRLFMETLEDRRVPAVIVALPSAADGCRTVCVRRSSRPTKTSRTTSSTFRPASTNLTLANTNGHENAGDEGGLNLTAVNHTTTIQGAGAGVTIIDGGSIDRVFEVMSGVTAVFRDLTIQNGLAEEAGNPGTLPDVEPSLGGGLLNFGTTTLDHVDVQNNAALGGPGSNGSEAPGVGVTPPTGGLSGVGGGIYNVGVLTLTDSIVRNNSAEGGPAAPARPPRARWFGGSGGECLAAAYSTAGL